ncbi:taurine catabolism dioxygenase TauD, TfdA family protein [Caballeronia calidae]|uniref:Taurine catabolism dioxygenase TauD, TfdA family protein n=1 Tax=Caballeronia calidae TaxID=1777139 RepID=A0A158EJV8_9BURK|nr:taurine catabolism dioxygenase TauD, TfdA family protein [Caballeronia calidae]
MIKIEKLTACIGAEVSGVDLGDASRDESLFAEIRALLLQHRVLFFRDQDMSRAEHVAFARRFGELEEHPVAGSDPEHPGLVRIYRSEAKNPYENNYHTDGLWRPDPSMGAVLRCIECPETGGDTIWVNMVEAYRQLPDDIKRRIEGLRVYRLRLFGHAFAAQAANFISLS